jgi:hypothetical protein
MDVSKVKAALAAAKSAVKDAVDAEIKARSFNGLRALAGVDTSLTRAESKLESAVKRAAPREKKVKKAKAPAIVK